MEPDVAVSIPMFHRDLGKAANMSFFNHFVIQHFCMPFEQLIHLYSASFNDLIVSLHQSMEEKNA